MADYNLGTASGKIEIDGDPAKRGFEIAQRAAGVFASQVKKQVEQVQDVGKKMAAVGAAGVAGFGMAVNAASKFATQMSAVQAVSGANTEEFERLRSKAMQLGKDTSFSATEAASALEELVKAGLSVEDTLNGAADATVALAAAGGVSLPEAATISANAMNQFNLDAAAMPRVADLIAGAANASAIDVGQFAQSLSQSGAVANLAGLSFDDLAVAIAEMGNAGIVGSDAGTSLKTMLTNLIPTTDQQKEMFLDLGLITLNGAKAFEVLEQKGIKPATKGFNDIIWAIAQYNEKQGGAKAETAAGMKAAMEAAQEMGVLKNQFFDATGKAKDLSSMQGILAESMKGLTKEQKLQKLEVLFGSDAIRAAAVLADEGSAGFDKMAAAMGKVTAADVAATRLDNLSGSLEQMKGSFETAQIVIGNVFIPVVRFVVDTITKVINVFNNLPSGVQKAIAIFFGVVSVLLLVVGTVLALLTPIALLIAQFLLMRVLGSVTAVLRVFFAQMRAGVGITNAWAAAQARAQLAASRWLLVGRIMRRASMMIAWAGRMMMIAFPWVAAIAGLVALGVLLYKKWKPFRDLADSIARFFVGVWNNVVKKAKIAWELFMDELSDPKGGEMLGGFLGLVQKAAWMLLAMWKGLKQVGAAFMENVVPALKGAWNMLRGAVMGAFKEYVGVLKNELLPALQQLWRAFQTDILPALKMLWNAVKPVLKILGIALAVVLVVIWKLFIAWAKFLAGTVLPIIIKVAAFILTFLVKALAFLVVWLTRIISWIIRFAAFLIGHISTALNFIKDVWSKVWPVLAKIIKIALIIVIGIIVAWVMLMILWFKMVWTLLEPIIKVGWEIIKTIFKVALALIVGYVKAWIAIFKAVWNAVWPPIKAAAQLAWAGIKAVFQTAVAIITTVIRGWIRIFKAIWNAIWPPLKAVLKTFWDGVKIIISGALAVVKGVFNTAKTVITRTWKALWDALDGPVKVAKAAVMAVIEPIGNAILAVFDIGQKMYDAGKAILMKLKEGAEAVLDVAMAPFKKAASIIGGLIPGSPVRTGPLQVLNNGEAGKKILQMLAQGIEAESSKLEATMSGVSMRVATALPTAFPPGLSAAPRRGGDGAAAATSFPPAPLIGHQTVINPIAEPASQTASREAADLAFLGRAG